MKTIIGIYIWLLCGFIIFLHADKVRIQTAKQVTTVIRMDNLYFHKNGGYPPPDRNAYLPIISSVKSYAPKVIFFDITFVRPPLKSEESFAKKINATQKLILPFLVSNADYEENFEGNQVYFGTKISAHRLPITRHPNSVSGVIMPYPEMVAESEKICVYEITQDDDYVVRSFYPFFYYKNYLFPSATLCILNAYLADKNLKLDFSDNYEDLLLLELKFGKWVLRKKVFRFLSEGEEKPIPLKYWNPTFFQAQDVLEKRVSIEKNQIIIIGPAADGISAWLPTPIGTLSRLDILANEVNTLWSMIKNEIPAEKP